MLEEGDETTGPSEGAVCILDAHGELLGCNEHLAREAITLPGPAVSLPIMPILLSVAVGTSSERFPG